ncbi:hypothetical protein EV175_003100 [Coemansia sp. RSA 1933]|nr:hypothetical protein EV175_003100 [Coemansia sp. RSA 1933]
MTEASHQVQQQTVDDAAKLTAPSKQVEYPWKFQPHKDDGKTDKKDQDEDEEPPIIVAQSPDKSPVLQQYELPRMRRLDGWPTEFPRNLEAYRTDILNNATHQWASDYEKHRMEIAPWRANAAFVVLVRNRELDAFLRTLRQLEERFNHRYHYPYVFLNDKPFTQRFMRTVAASTTSNVTFALIPHDHWSIPDFIDEEKAREARQQMKANRVIYGGSLSYRHMCRYNSGFFYKHPVLRSVDWYWRVEPGVDFYCDLPYDPFMYMQQSGKLYSFVIALKEIESTIPTLWDHTLEYMRQNNVSSDWLSYFVDINGDYNMCHFWSNFEIASLNWMRSAPYERFFEYLDQAKGFFMERWGDAPVHSLAAGLLLRKEQVHFFDDIGYRHENFARCPTSTVSNAQLRCTCPENLENFDEARGSCLPRWKAYQPQLWTAKDTEEAGRMVKAARFVTAGREPRMIKERRRWYSFFGRL